MMYWILTVFLWLNVLYALANFWLGIVLPGRRLYHSLIGSFNVAVATLIWFTA